MAREQGKVLFFDARKGFGKIEPASGGDEIFVHISQVEGEGVWTLAPGEVVEYELKATERGPNAVNVRRTEERHTGSVEYWDTKKGYGFIQPDGQDEPVFVHYSDIATQARFKRLEEGQEVDFALAPGKEGKPKAVRVVPDMRTPLERFAVLPRFDEKLEELKELAQDEEWDYHFTESRRPHPILHSYVNYTFRRIQEEGKIAYSQETERGQELACFNTGLVTEFYEPIFAAFRENRDETGPKFVLIGFFTESSYPVTCFAKRPDMANYFTDPTELLYDRRLDLVKNVSHIVTARLERFPPEFHDNPARLSSALDIAIARAEQRVLRNYKTAIPQYNRGRIQLLLPICLTDPRRADVALVVGREGAVYKGYTVLSLDMAYNNARLLTRPDREWLIP